MFFVSGTASKIPFLTSQLRNPFVSGRCYCICRHCPLSVGTEFWLFFSLFFVTKFYFVNAIISSNTDYKRNYLAFISCEKYKKKQNSDPKKTRLHINPALESVIMFYAQKKCATDKERLLNEYKSKFRERIWCDVEKQKNKIISLDQHNVTAAIFI